MEFFCLNYGFPIDTENNMKVGFLHSIIRKEEKLLLAELRNRKDVELVKIDDRQQFFDLFVIHCTLTPVSEYRPRRESVPYTALILHALFPRPS